jgi:bacillithiol biosynthesis cysteine-adding enzyme BshC
VTLELHPTPFAPPPTAPWAALAAARGVPPAPTLRPAFLADGPAAAGLERLLEGGALCVTTGQQPGLFLGPLFTVYKALTAVALAERLARDLDRPVVPVFWVAGDDHDFLESARAHTLSAGGEVATLALPERAADAPLTPMYREPLGAAVLDLLAAFWAEQPPTEFRAGVEQWLARHYTPEQTVAEAFAGTAAQLLGPLGVIVFRPTHRAAKAAMAPHLLRALERAAAVDRLLADRAAALTAAGRPAPVPVGEGASLVMLEGAAGRDRLLPENGAFHLRRSGERFSLAELGRLAEQSPERLSPNVLLRPVIEAALLPTVAYVGGPGELAYFPQCEPVYEALGIAPQAPVPRWSGIVIEARTRKVLDKYGLGLDDLRLAEGQLEQRLVRGDLPPDAVEAFANLQAALEREYDRLREAATAIDPTLRKPVESTRNAALAGARDIEKRLLGHLKQRNETLVQQVARTRTTLFPLGKPQERVLGVAPFLTRYGDAFLATVLDAVRRWLARA